MIETGLYKYMPPNTLKQDYNRRIDPTRIIGLADPSKYERNRETGDWQLKKNVGEFNIDIEKKVGLPLLAIGILIAVILIVFGRK